MSARSCAFWLMLVIVWMMLSPGVLYAEAVQHHGLMVEADDTLTYCVSCHDGSVASNASFCTVQCSATTPHPVQKHYPPLGKEKLYAPTGLVQAKGIKLPEGKVTCISCHNLRNPGKNHLVIDNRGSRLCLTCHIRM